MKLLLLLLLLFCAAATPARAQLACDRFSGATQVGSSPVTERVSAISTKRIYLCGYVFIRSGGPDLDIEISTGSGVNCAINKTLLLPRFSLPGNVPLVNRNPFASEYTPVGNALCTETFGSGTFTAIFYWAQY